MLARRLRRLHERVKSGFEFLLILWRWHYREVTPLSEPWLPNLATLSGDSSPGLRRASGRRGSEGCSPVSSAAGTVSQLLSGFYLSISCLAGLEDPEGLVCARTRGGRHRHCSARPKLLRTAQDWKARAPDATAEREGEGVEGEVYAVPRTTRGP